MEGAVSGMVSGIFRHRPHSLNRRNDVLFVEKCIRLVHEKLAIFPCGQYIVGIYVLLAFRRYSQVQDRSGDSEEMYKNITLNTRKMAIPAARRVRRAADDAIIMTYINTQRSASKYTITACLAKVKFKVSAWT